MPRKPRTLLLRLEVRPAGRGRKCKRNAQHVIVKGELHLVVKDPGPASGEKPYCANCGQEMLAAAAEAIDAHAAALGAGALPR